MKLKSNLKPVIFRNYKCRLTETLLKSKVINFSKITIQETLRVIEMIFTCASNKLISSQIGVCRKTVYNLKKILKTELRKMFWKKKPNIGGNMIVEADESKFGRRKYNRGHRVEGVWVLGVVERSISRKMLYFIVKNRKKNTINEIFKRHINQQSIIYTDKWKGYSGLNNIGYTHNTVNHSIHFVNPITGVHTNTIEGNWCALKTMIPKRHRTRK